MALIKDIRIGMSVNPGPLAKGLKSAEMSLGRFESAARGVQAVILGLGAGLVVGKLTSGIGGAVGAASDLNEQISKSQVVFGKASSIVEAKAKDMADAFGYPRAQFIEGASSIGLIAKASGLAQEGAAKMGSDFASLAADAASFYNVPVEEALMAIRSGLVGEAEPMRRFGVLLNESAVKAEALRLGLAKAGAELTDGQKVQARASLITKGLADAQGDLARTANSVANLSRAAEGRMTNAMADMGTAIQPVTERLYALREAALKALTDELSANADSIKAWATGASASGGLVFDTFEKVAKGIAVVVDLFGALNIAVKVQNVAFADLMVGYAKFEAFGANLRVKAERAAFGAPTQVGQIEAGKAATEVRRQQQFAAVQRDQLNKALIAPSAKEGLAATFDKIRAGAAGINVAQVAAKAAPGAEIAAVNAKVSKSISDLATSLQAEIATFGMAGKAAEIYKLKLAGASEGQLKFVKTLDMQLQAKQLREDIKTPLDKLAADRSRLQGLFNAGQINKTEFGKGMGLAREAAGFSNAPRFAAATTAGSTEAYSAQLRFGAMRSAQEEPMKATAKATQKSVDVQQQMLGALNKLVDRGVAQVGAAAVELFALR